VTGSDTFTEASKKRKVNATRKAPVKCLRASGQKKGDSMKAVVSQGKTGLKQPFD
jgi:hypothetical protein